MKNQKGIGIIGLILIVVAIITIIFCAIKLGKQEIEKQDMEDIKTNMLAIQGKAQTIASKHELDSEAALVGTYLDVNNNETEFVISDELKAKLTEIENANLYIFTAEDLNNNGLKGITVTNTEFYVVDYNTCEVYYSEGYTLSTM